MRTVYNMSRVNNPRTIAGIEWKLVVALSVFFGMSAVAYRAPFVLTAPVLILWFLSGPGRRDHDFLKIYRRHATQRDHYSPAQMCATNLRFPRPAGFSRMDVV